MTQNILNLILLISASLFLIFGFITPYHFEPWRSAFSEFGVFIGMALVLISISLKYRDYLAPKIKTFFLILLLSLAGLFIHGENNQFITESNYLFLFYICFGYICFIIGFNEKKNKNIILILMASFFIGSILQVGTGLAQWLGLFDAITVDNWWGAQGKGGQRVSGNLLQANNYATYILVGFLSFFYITNQQENVGKLKFSMFSQILIPSFFSVGLVIAQSRTSILSILIASVLIYLCRRKFSQQLLKIWLIFASATLLLWYLIPALAGIVFVESADAVARAFVSADLRFKAWPIFIQSAFESFQTIFFGRGWGSIASVHVNYAATALQNNIGFGIFAHTHNIFIDIFVAFGVIGLALFIYLLVALYPSVRHALSNTESLTLLLILLVFFIHANLELPHWYGYFLWPAAFITGLIYNSSTQLTNIRSTYLMGFIISICVLGIHVFDKYLTFEKALSSYALQVYQRGMVYEPVNLDTKMLPGLSELFSISELNINEPPSTHNYIRIYHAARFSPSAFTISRAIYAAALSLKYDDYVYFSTAYCRIFGNDSFLKVNRRARALTTDFRHPELPDDCRSN